MYTGKVAEHILEEAGMTCNKNGIPFDPQPPAISSGIRLLAKTLLLIVASKRRNLNKWAIGSLMCWNHMILKKKIRLSKEFFPKLTLCAKSFRFMVELNLQSFSEDISSKPI